MSIDIQEIGDTSNLPRNGVVQCNGNCKAVPNEDENSRKSSLTDLLEKSGALYLFGSRRMALRTLNMFYQWFAVTLAYYGLSFSSTDLAGDPYSNFCSSVSVEIPGSTITITS